MQAEKVKKMERITDVELENDDELDAVKLSVEKIGLDLRRAIKSGKIKIGREEARFMVDYYYDIQQSRCGTANQLRSAQGKSLTLIDWLHRQFCILENQIFLTMDAWTDTSEVSKWAKSICGIGPILSAGLEAHIDIEQAPTVGRIWSFAGLNPNQKWLGNLGAEKLVKRLGLTKKNYKDEKMIALVSEETGRSIRVITNFVVNNNFKDFRTWLAKRPWNTPLKTLCWKIGQSFIKVSNNPKSWFGARYKERKAEEILKNMRGEFKDVAKQELETKKYGKTTEAYKAYKEGKLPALRITNRAARYAMKLFLSIWHEIAYKERFKKDPPKPYVIEHMGHVRHIKPEEVS